MREALFGNASNARQQAEVGLRNTADNYKVGTAAFALALSGDTAAAEKLAARIAKDAPSDTQVNYIYVPVIRAAIHVQHRAPERAIKTAETALPYDKTNMGMYVRLLSAHADLQSGRSAEAVAELQSLLNQRDNLANFPIKPAAMVGLAQAYAAAGNPSRAKAAYEDFFKFWQDADADIPLLRRAKEEYARLQ